jgi:hypothetical protein
MSGTGFVGRHVAARLTSAGHDAVPSPFEPGRLKARSFLLGLVAGALGGFLLLEFGIGLPFLGPLAIVVGAAAPPIPFGAAGTLIGWGTLWAAAFANAARACAVDQNCGDQTPSVAPWVAAGACLIVAGFALLLRLRGRPAGP